MIRHLQIRLIQYVCLGIGTLCTLALAALCYRDLLLQTAGGFLVRSDPPVRADLIVVLGGDFYGHRVLEGAELGRQGFAGLVLVSGPPYNGKPEGELAIDFAVRHGYGRSSFSSVPHRATSTFDEALVLRTVFRRLRARRVLLVTSRYHTRRAGLIFDLTNPGIEFRVIAPRQDTFDTSGWWNRPEVRQAVCDEWLKILWNVGVRYPVHLAALPPLRLLAQP